MKNKNRFGVLENEVEYEFLVIKIIFVCLFITFAIKNF